MSKIPDRVWCRSFPTQAEIKELLDSLTQYHISAESLKLVHMLAGQPPERRLAINLKTLLGLCINNQINNVLNEGMTERERRVLIELDSSGLSVRLREVAHGLLNVHERWRMLKSLSEPFHQARAAHKNYLQQTGDNSHLLDSTLG